jgi:hypothetical protein
MGGGMPMVRPRGFAQPGTGGPVARSGVLAGYGVTEMFGLVT